LLHIGVGDKVVVARNQWIGEEAVDGGGVFGHQFAQQQPLRLNFGKVGKGWIEVC
jgi:hypothetical protein